VKGRKYGGIEVENAEKISVLGCKNHLGEVSGLTDDVIF
jgi:hypothetical protein